MIQILNPIYDTSFKFLMSDEKVARILLSALLKRSVTSLSLSSQEYADTVGRDRSPDRDYPIYRLDFKATVEDESPSDGAPRQETVLIELQKVWLQTELFRFRKYLGGQYSDPGNVRSDGRTPRHIVAIYLLGHTLPSMREPIAYGYGRSLVDYDGRPISMGVPSDFVDSLTHDIVIVQIPRLPSRPGNAAERLLGIFDQRHCAPSDRCVLNLPDGVAGMSVDERAVVERLRAGLLDSEMRRKMSVEEEILWELDSRDVKIEHYKAEAERNRAEAEKSKAEAERNKAEAEKSHEALRLAVHGFQRMGMGAEEIARLLNVGSDDVRGLMEETKEEGV